MYAALWRKLPGPAPVKWLLTLILFTGLFFLLGGYFPVGVVLDAVQRSGGVAAGRKGYSQRGTGGAQARSLASSSCGSSAMTMCARSVGRMKPSATM
mgnify:FL=1